MAATWHVTIQMNPSECETQQTNVNNHLCIQNLFFFGTDVLLFLCGCNVHSSRIAFERKHIYSGRGVNKREHWGCVCNEQNTNVVLTRL